MVVHTKHHGRYKIFIESKELTEQFVPQTLPIQMSQKSEGTNKSFLCVDQKKAESAALGAMGVIAGVITKKTFEQMNQSDHIVSTLAGPALFLAGWVQTAKVLAEKDEQGNIMKTPRTYMAIGACSAIAVAVMTIKRSSVEGVPAPDFAAPLFMAGWVMIGYLSSDNNQNKIAYLIPTLVILSMKFILPWQRANGIVDGPGLPLFIAAWILFVYLQSNK